MRWCDGEELHPNGVAFYAGFYAAVLRWDLPPMASASTQTSGWRTAPVAARV